MANNTVEARINLITGQSHARLAKLEQKIHSMTNAMTKFQNAVGRSNNSIATGNTALNKAEQSTKKAVTQADKLAQSYLNATHNVYLLNRGMRDIATGYIGAIGIKAGLDMSDSIVSANNKLNYVNARTFTNQGVPQSEIIDTETGKYTQKVISATQSDMDKMYASAQKVRMGYSDMMANVAKSMTLAGSAFQDNVDNAIRFQEVMAEAYAIGGASGAEMSASMYQMIQALGSGILQGDELRSVREGASLAYQQIEKFAQSVYNTEESLKDLASEGKITSDIVVAAMLSASGEIDEAFALTTITFSQTFTKLANTAKKAFEPVFLAMNRLLNSDFGKILVDEISKLIVFVSYALQIVFMGLEKLFNWMAQNWYWMKYIVYGAVLAISIAFMSMIGQMVVALIGFIGTLLFGGGAILLMVNKIILGVALVIAFFVALTKTVNDGYTLIIGALTAIAMALLIIGVITGNIPLIVVAVVVAVVGLIMNSLEYIIGGIYVVKAMAWNFLYFIGNVFNAIGNTIGSAIEHGFLWATSAWNNFLADIIEGSKIIQAVLNGIAKLTGNSTWSVTAKIDELRSNAKRASEKDTLGSLNNLDEAWVEGITTFESKDLGTEALKGIAKGNEYKGILGDYASGLYDKVNGIGDKIGNTISSKIAGIPSGFGIITMPNINDPANQVSGNGYDQTNALKGTLGDIADDTGKISDSMELRDEDLEYLRDLAEMEWKKEFTTAEIKVDMSNYNTINGESDLEGLVTKLTSVLYEEMALVADGVYA